MAKDFIRIKPTGAVVTNEKYSMQVLQNFYLSYFSCNRIKDDASTIASLINKAVKDHY